MQYRYATTQIQLHASAAFLPACLLLSLLLVLLLP